MLHPLRPWENHPFSVLQTAVLQPSGAHCGFDSNSQSKSSTEQPDNHHDVEKTDSVTVKPRSEAVLQHSHPSIGLTLYVRRLSGATKLLAAHDNLLTLVEGPYPSNSTREVLRCDRVLLICGGIGITGLLPFVNNHWNVKLAWSAKKKARCLVEDLDGALSAVADKELRIGGRLDIGQRLKEEIKTGWERVGVVVCGPAGLCDDTRAAVAAASKLVKTEFELEVEVYSW